MLRHSDRKFEFPKTIEFLICDQEVSVDAKDIVTDWLLEHYRRDLVCGC
uniref:Uncharacterized protein n=1 Tax=viral metagenome TaxID=1070528 RepID=A0A6C0EJP1_9ZZZZ